ncbi:MAG TPA: hypothetical protein VGQ53_09415 [Chitinophagaceae bacterium]|jgi:hypothetical protein|nr:hypothetical protein [Chitinophagaceae bacterium]
MIYIMFDTITPGKVYHSITGFETPKQNLSLVGYQLKMVDVNVTLYSKK